MGNSAEATLHQQIGRLFQDGSATGLSDAELLRRYLMCRDEAAFEALVRLHGPMVLGLCRRMLRNPQEVEDAFQATFLILVRKAPGIRDRKLLGNWLYGVAYRVASRARKNAARSDYSARNSARVEDLLDDARSSSDHADWLPILDQELNRLPEKYRAPIVLCHLDGRTHEQSAGELGVPVGTVRSRLARGRDLLRKRLERRGVAPGLLVMALDHGSSTSQLLAIVPASLVQSTIAVIGQTSALPWTLGLVSTGMTTASSFTLARGVVAAMFFKQIKLATAGVLALSVVGVGFVQNGRAVGGASGGPQTEPTQQQPEKTARKDEKQTERLNRKALHKAEEVKDAPNAPYFEYSEIHFADDAEFLKSVESRFQDLKNEINRLHQEIKRTSPDALRKLTRVPAKEGVAFLSDPVVQPSFVVNPTVDQARPENDPPAKAEAAPDPDKKRKELEFKIRMVEHKLEELAAQPRQAIQPSQPSRNEIETGRLDPRSLRLEPGMSIPEFEAEIAILKRRLPIDRKSVALAKNSAEVPNSQQERGAGLRLLNESLRQLDETRAAIDRLVAKLQRFQTEIEQEVAAHDYELERKEAELGGVRANRVAVTRRLARNRSHHERDFTPIADEETEKDEAELKRVDSQLQAVLADVNFLRKKKGSLLRPSSQIGQLLDDAKKLAAEGSTEQKETAEPKTPSEVPPLAR